MHYILYKLRHLTTLPPVTSLVIGDMECAFQFMDRDYFKPMYVVVSH